MSAAGYIKGQITKAANALRTKKSGFDASILERFDPTEDPGECLHLLHDRKSTLINTSASLRKSLVTLKEKWGLAENFAHENPESDSSLPLLEEFQTHWEDTGLDQLVDETEELITKLETALMLLPSSDSTSTTFHYTIPHTIVSFCQKGK
ncbi:hypothetical protein Y032_0328g2642 [Ancylostoma ceylanicum]|uniref:Uncharacterized protein n=1 Tax=Ancylostoma ceylanicum TaxID=53326 RepID=A0A016RZP8_9BILA|nr:hypothetical protein Y032_0328g2642 [Ancylostoma ceylanicum]